MANNNRISSIQDIDHYYEFLKEKGDTNNNFSRKEYLNYVNNTPELYEKYAPGDRAQKEANLAHNLGANWRDIYDFDTGKYVDGFDINSLTDGRIGIYNTYGYDIGARDRKGNGYEDGFGGGYSRTEKYYNDMLNELRQRREEEFNKNKKTLEERAKDASRQAYILKQQSLNNLDQQNALIGLGGLSESGLIQLDSNYQNSLKEINKLLSEGISKLESEKNNGEQMDTQNVQKQLIKEIEKKKAAAQKKNEAIRKSAGSIITSSKTKKSDGTIDYEVNSKEKLAKMLELLGYTQSEIRNYFGGTGER